MSKIYKMSVAVLALTLALGMTSGMAEAKSKTKRAAEIATKLLPIPKPAKTLVKANIRIYDRVGWEAGRLISTIEHGPAGDPGNYPGYNN